jgi:hypothetical protein
MMVAPESPIKRSKAEDAFRPRHRIRRWFVQVEGRFEQKLLSILKDPNKERDWDIRRARGKKFVYKDTAYHLGEKETFCIGIVDFDGFGEFHTAEYRDEHDSFLKRYSKNEEDMILLRERIRDTRKSVCFLEWLEREFELDWVYPFLEKIHRAGYVFSEEEFDELLPEAYHRSYVLAQRQLGLNKENAGVKPHVAARNQREYWSEMSQQDPAPLGWSHWNDHCLCAVITERLMHQTASLPALLQENVEDWLSEVFFNLVHEIGLTLPDFLEKFKLLNQ